MRGEKIYKAGMILIVMLAFMPAAYSMDFGGWGDLHDDEKGYEEIQKVKQERCTRFLTELGLSQEQMKAVETQRQKREENRPELHAKMREVKTALRTQLDAAETDTAEVERLIDESSELMKQMMRERVDSVLELKAILTPDQFAALRAKKEQMFKERREKWKMKEKREE